MRALIGSLSLPHAVRASLMLVATLVSAAGSPVAAQNGQGNGVSGGGQGSANYPMAARFAPYKISTLLHTTTLQPNWINGGDRFWYQWETSSGRSYYVVDPARATRTPIFDNDRIAARDTSRVQTPGHFAPAISAPSSRTSCVSSSSDMR